MDIMDIHGYLWISMDIYRYFCIIICIHHHYILIDGLIMIFPSLSHSIAYV